MVFKYQKISVVDINGIFQLVLRQLQNTLVSSTSPHIIHTIVGPKLLNIPFSSKCFIHFMLQLDSNIRLIGTRKTNLYRDETKSRN